MRLLLVADIAFILTIYCAIPMTPQAGRGPALPVFLLSSWPPFPRSSVPAWMTRVRCHLISSNILVRGELTYAKNAVLANDLDEVVGKGALGVTLIVSLEVA
jgi:hypothetical protein